MTDVAIVDYGMCNLDSVARAVEECGGKAHITQNPKNLATASHIILPGVGAFPDAMKMLHETGMDVAIREQVIGERIPFLGICLGMQLMATRGFEIRESTGLDLIPGEVHRLKPSDHSVRIPHIGWNEVRVAGQCPLFKGISANSDFYFVHSYHFCCEDDYVAARTPYADGFVSAVQRQNVFGTQFHPEKSQRLGFQLLGNFLALQTAMLKIRVMPTLLYKDYGLVKGIGFDSWRRTGSAMQQIKVYNIREVDELVLLDITANAEFRAPDYEMIDHLADDCFMPMTVGGGIRKLDQAQRVLRVGADKVAINTGAVENPRLITEIAERFGTQCVVVSIDYRQHADGRREVFTYSGKRATGLDATAFAVESERRGAGEILLTSIERDGSFEGYDLEGIRAVTSAVSIPVIASGGAGCYEHMRQAINEGGASAVAAGSIFHFTEKTPLESKRYLHDCGLAVRLQQPATFKHTS